MTKVENRETVSPVQRPILFLFYTSCEDVDVNLKLLELLSQDSQSKLPSPGQEEVQVRLA